MVQTRSLIDEQGLRTDGRTIDDCAMSRYKWEWLKMRTDLPISSLGKTELLQLSMVPEKSIRNIWHNLIGVF